jgi:CRP-like cAMP-binding protein
MIDFGCAYITEDDQVDIFNSDPSDTVDKRSKFKSKKFSSTGTTAYWSPERFNTKRQIALREAPGMDMWSVGVILYIMLTGAHPFDPQGCFTDEEIEEQIKRNPNPPLSDDLVGHLSDSAVDLIKKLMEPDPMKRITAYQMLHHPWVRGETASKEKIQDSDKKLSHFKDIRYPLEAGMFAVLVSQGYADARMSEGKISRQNSGGVMQGNNDKEQDEEEHQRESATHIMQRAFAVFDAEGKGFVTSDDLGRVASELTGSVLSSHETKEYLQASQEDSVNGQTNLSLAQFNKLFSGLNQKHFPRGHYIFHAGDSGDAMYFLSSGKVEIQTRKGQLVAMLRSGDFFGEGSLLDPSNLRFTSARCATPVDVIEIKRHDFDRYIGASKTAKRDLHVKWRARSLAYAKNLLRLQTNLKARNYREGDVVYKEGDIGTSMFRVDDDPKVGGTFDVSHKGRVTHKYVPGDSFGESSLLFKRPRS